MVHLSHHHGESATHQIWRIYRGWGWMTDRVICTCGAEFTIPPAGAKPIDQLLAEIEVRKAQFKGMRATRHG